MALFNLSKKIHFFYKESVVYPFVEIEEGKKGLMLSNTAYLDIIYYMENSMPTCKCGVIIRHYMKYFH